MKILPVKSVFDSVVRKNLASIIFGESGKRITFSNSNFGDSLPVVWPQGLAYGCV